MSARNIGIPGVSIPSDVCQDYNCPFHGTLRIRGRILQGVVGKKRMKNTVTIRRDYVQFIKKYQRYERRNSIIAAHLPPCLSSQINEGDLVKIGECRPISKTKAFCVIQKIEK
jgi:small subunit ribosomal protein S17